MAALLRKLYELDLDYEVNLVSNAQVLAVPFLKKLCTRLEKKLMKAKPAKEVKLSMSKYEVVAVHTLLHNDLNEMFYSSIFCKIEQKYCSIQGVFRID
jgi:hypothetical protein